MEAAMDTLDEFEDKTNMETIPTADKSEAATWFCRKAIQNTQYCSSQGLAPHPLDP